MVYGFVRQSGGAVDIETAEGQGTSVRLYLPAINSDSRASAEPEGHAEEAAQTALDATILLVEDNVAFREVTCDILRSLNFEVIDVGTAEEALEVIVGPTKFDLLLSDIGLPGDLNGHDLAGYAASMRPELKIVLMSAHTDPVMIGGDIDANVSAFIRKPHRKAELSNALRQMLDCKIGQYETDSLAEVISFPARRAL